MTQSLLYGAVLVGALLFSPRPALAQAGRGTREEGRVLSAKVRGDTVVIIRRGSSGQQLEERWVFAPDSSVIDANTGRTMLSAKRARQAQWLRSLRLMQRADSMRRTNPRPRLDN